MPVNDKRLEELAKAVAGQTSATTSYLGFSEATTAVDTSATSFASEVGSRVALTNVRTLNEVEFVGLRSSTDVVDTVNGDDLNKIGTFETNVSTQQFEESNLSGINHTINFDVEVVINFAVNRR